MNDRLLELGLAGQAPHAAIDRALAHRLLALAALDQLGALHRRTAYRAMGGDLHRPGIRWPPLRYHLHDLRDDVPGAAHDHAIADHHPQAGDLIHVVQGGVGHGDARHLYRLETGDRGDGPGAPHLEFDIEQLGQLFASGKLVRQRPARLARAKTQLTLPVETVDLVDHTVDLIG